MDKTLCSQCRSRGSIPVRELDPTCMLQLRVHRPQLKNLQDKTRTCFLVYLSNKLINFSLFIDLWGKKDDKHSSVLENKESMMGQDKILYLSHEIINLQGLLFMLLILECVFREQQ